MLDALTYAGNRANLDPVADRPPPELRRGQHPRCRARRLPGLCRPTPWSTSRPSRTSTGRSPVRARLRDDQRRRHPDPARRGDASRPRPVPARLDRRGLRLDRRGLLARDAPARAQLAVRRIEGLQRPARARLRPHARSRRRHHALLEQLRALPVPREGHPAVRHQPHRRRHHVPLYGDGHERPRLAARRRPLPRHRSWRSPAVAAARSTTSAAAPSSPTRSSPRSCSSRQGTDWS